jgi:Flp pilus assembly protein TadB
VSPFIDTSKNKITIAVTWCLALTGLAVALLVSPADRQLRLASIAIPLATLGLTWLIWLRQRRSTKLTQARLSESASVLARVSALSDALEQQRRLIGSKDLLEQLSYNRVKVGSDRLDPTLH